MTYTGDDYWASADEAVNSVIRDSQLPTPLTESGRKLHELNQKWFMEDMAKAREEARLSRQ